MKLSKGAKRWSTRWGSDVNHSRLRDHVVPLAIAVVVLWWVFPIWHGGGQLGLDDLSNLNVPQRMLLGWFYHTARELPFWNPFNFGGQPFLAAGQSGPLYLPNVVFVFLPIRIAIRVSYTFHILIALFGMYAATWRLSKSRLGSMVSALAFVASGFMLGHQIHTQMFDAMCWLPLLFYLMVRIQRAVTPISFTLLALCFAGSVYAGHPQITFYTVLILTFYPLCLYLQNLSRRQLERAAAVYAALALGAAMSLPQWLPTFNLLSYSNRAHVDASQLLGGSFPASGLAQFLSPFSAGGGYGRLFSAPLYGALYANPLYWEFVCYAGLVTLVVATAAMIHGFRKSSAIRNLTLLTLLALSLTFGADSALKDVLLYVPGFNLFRIPARYVGIIDFSLPMLLGIGVAMLEQGDIKHQKMKFVVGMTAALYALAFTALRLFGPLKFLSAASTLLPLAALVLIATLSLLPAAVFRPRIYVTVLVGLSILDVLSQSTIAKLITVAQANYSTPTAAVTFLSQHLSKPYPFVRVAAMPDTSLSHDQSAAYRIPSIDGYDSLEPRWYVSHVGLTWQPDILFEQPRSLLDNLDVQYIVTSEPHLKVLPVHRMGRESITHWFSRLSAGADALQISVTPRGKSLPMIEPLFRVQLYSGSEALSQQVTGSTNASFLIPIPKDWPRQLPTKVVVKNESWMGGYKITELRLVENDASSLVHVTLNQPMGPKPWTLVFASHSEFIWKNPDTITPVWLTRRLAAPLGPSDAGSAALATWTPNKQTWHLDARTNGWFVLSQMYDPNWSAAISGRPVEVKSVDDILTGVTVPKGQHILTLTYSPKGFWVGYRISVVTALLLLILTYRWRRFLKMRGTPAERRLKYSA